MPSSSGLKQWEYCEFNNWQQAINEPVTIGRNN